MGLLQHLKEVNCCLKVTEAKHLHTHEVIKKSNCGNSVLNSLLCHFLRVAIHKYILWLSKGDNLKEISFLD